jgi:tetratricopeptide (TPR) repeat protein
LTLVVNRFYEIAFMKKILLLTLLSFSAFAQTAESYNLKAKAHFEKGQFKEAIAALTLAIKLNPKDVKAWRNRAASYEKIEKFDLALKDYLEVAKYDPSSETLGNIGFDYLVLEKYDEAKKYLNQAIALSPKNSNLRYNLGLCYQYEENYALAITAYDEALKIEPFQSSSVISKTRCLLLLKQYDKASAIVDSFFVSKRFDVEMLLFRGDIKLHNGSVEAALNDFNRAIAINPEDLLLLNRAANCLEDLSLFDEEVAMRKRIVKVAEKQGETKKYMSISYGLLGFALYNAFLWEEALENLSLSISLEPSATFYFYRVAVKAKLKDNAGACEDLKKAQELNPSEAENYESYFAETAEFEEFYGVCFPGV